MGGKGTFGWKSFQVLAALIGLLLFGLAGCLPRVELKERAGMSMPEKDKEIKKEKAVEWISMIRERDFATVLKRGREVLKDSSDESLRQEALYYMAIAELHPDNPSKNLQRASGYFKKLLNEYPESALAVQARAWLGLISIIEKSKRIDIEIEKKKHEFSK
ncbi:MAG: hypothetical protein D6710_03655 [Nitrospirae bacterium]|nr:MAG: hypothetical protein D6710_03655 [Nitrospirota bacterium]